MRKEGVIIKKKKEYSAETRKRMSLAQSNRSAETRKRMSEAQKGKKHTAETKKKMSLAHKGRKGFKHTTESKKKMSLANTGRKHSAEFGKRMSELTTGKNNPMYGKTHTAETKRKISLAKGNLSAETRKKLSISNSGKNHPNWGKHRSKETKRKIGIANKGKLAGEKSHCWRGGIANDPYCDAWSDEEYKQSIFKRDNYTCQNTECSGISEWLVLHHIDYDKGNCNSKNILTLCNSCNSKANFDRKWHTSFYQEIMRRNYLKLENPVRIKLNRRKVKLNRRNPMSRAKELLKLDEAAKKKQMLTQYNTAGNLSRPTGKTIEKLKPGVYNVKSDMTGPLFELHSFSTDELLRFKDSKYEWLLEEVEKFWELKPDFDKLHFTHKRGILMHGPAGSGKSCLIRLLMESVVNDGNVVFITKDMHTLVNGLTLFREVEPDRKCLVVIEDVDSVINYGGEHALLELLDGDSQIDNVMYIGTTNYIERLPPRVLRESRFDRRVEILHPPRAGRFAYLDHKLQKYQTKKTIDELADKTDGFSFAQLRELLVGLYCLKSGTIDEEVERIRGVPVEDIKSTEKGLVTALKESLEPSTGQRIFEKLL